MRKSSRIIGIGLACAVSFSLLGAGLALVSDLPVEPPPGLVATPRGAAALAGDQPFVSPEVAKSLTSELEQESLRDLGSLIYDIAQPAEGFAYAYQSSDGFVVAFSGAVPQAVAEAFGADDRVKFVTDAVTDLGSFDAYLHAIVTAIAAELPTDATTGVGISHSSKSVEISITVTQDPDGTYTSDDFASHLTDIALAVGPEGYQPIILIGVNAAGGIHFL